jgi:LytS/YehU family sensor histidine kinase
LLLVIASFVLLLLRRSARRLRRIEDVADAVMAGDPTARVRDAAGPAGDSIGQALDQTLDAMASLVEQHKEDLQERQERELRALSNQIKPHFLFNALDTIQVMGRLGGDSEVEDAASVLSRILERSVGGREGPFTLADELANVRDFVRFQEYRHQTSIDLFIDYPEELGRVRVPAFFLQPIIENSIKHGFRNSGGSGVIDVEVRCEVGDLIVTVSDSGDGAELSAVDDDDTGHGLANVRRRLKLLYGARTSMQIDSAVGQGTSVRMVLPGQCRGALGLDHRQEASDSLQKPSEASADAPEASEIHQDCTSRRYM